MDALLVGRDSSGTGEVLIREPVNRSAVADSNVGEAVPGPARIDRLHFGKAGPELREGVGACIAEVPIKASMPASGRWVVTRERAWPASEC